MRFLAIGSFLGSPLGGALENQRFRSLTMKCAMKGSVACFSLPHKYPPASQLCGQTQNKVLAGLTPLQTSVDSRSPDSRSSLRREERFLKWKVPCDEIRDPKRHKLLLDSQPVDKKLQLTLMSEWGKKCLKPMWHLCNFRPRMFFLQRKDKHCQGQLSW